MTGADVVQLPGRDPSELVLTFAGTMVTHLGVKMYAGRPVPAIAELVSNAWDADAQNVAISIPLGKPWIPGDSAIVEVSDDGVGMNWDMVRDAYLDVGRDRRSAEGTDRTEGGRLLQGRKGVGKLAGFGIADIVEVQTIHKDPDPKLKKLALIWFRMSLAALQSAAREAPVELVYAGPVDRAPKGARKKRGTTVILRQLRERRALNEDRFHHAMAQRFLLEPGFRVELNDAELRDEDIKLQWRFPPKKGWISDVVAGHPVEYWLGFTHQPRKQDEGELSGVLIYTRHKISQEATFFEISGGTTGQHGLRYLVGKVRAEWLDPDAKTPDLIATHRGAIAWESPGGEAFQQWGQKLVRSHLAQWSKLRSAEREKHITKVRPEIQARIDRLPSGYRDVALQFVGKFNSIEMEVDDFESIFSWFLDALENATLRSILQKLRDTPTNDLSELDDLLTKMEVRTAVTLLQIVESNLAAIDALEKMHHEDAKERGVLSTHLEKNPWLIDPTWMLNKAEARVATWIQNEFGKPNEKKQQKTKNSAKGKGDDDRADFFCVAVGGVLHIVEIKRGGHVATTKDILQADKYRKYVLGKFDELKDKKSIRYSLVQSHLVAAELHGDADTLAENYADSGYVLFTTWDDLIERAKLSHQQFRTALETRVERAD